MLKKVSKVLLLLFLAFIFVVPQTQVKANSENKLIINYHRDDMNYADWGVWLWGQKGSNGQEVTFQKVEFNGQNNFGKSLTIELDDPKYDGITRMGYIIIKSEKPDSYWLDAEPYGTGQSNDRFVELTNSGVQAIYLHSSDASVYDSPLITNRQKTIASSVTLHYHRPDNDYSGWDFYVWDEGNFGKGIPFQGIDDYGAYATIDTSIWKQDRSGIIVRKGGDSWVGKDPDGDRYFDLLGDQNGHLDIYLESNDWSIYLDKNKTIKLSTSTFGTLLENDVISVATDPTGSKNLVLLDDQDQLLTTEYIGQNADQTSSYFKVLEGIDIRQRYRYQTSSKVEVQSLRYFTYFDTEEFKERYEVKRGSVQFGATLKNGMTEFNVWTPTASNVVLNVYDTGDGDTLISSYQMNYLNTGIWNLVINEDLAGKYYTYQVTNYSKTYEVVDPYALSAGVNGKRGYIVDVEKALSGFDDEYVSTTQSDAIIYEAHVRDLTISDTSGVDDALKGKFLGIVEKNAKGENLVLDHIKGLGITHIHFLPVFDFASIDESKPTLNKYNWGYDPLNYNVVEGSYSTDPYNGLTRMLEFKTMIDKLHNEEIGVVMDVVYNHTGPVSDNQFERLVPDYYFRMNSKGSMYNGSGTGNETASNHTMFRNYMVDSLSMWAKYYKIDGFRFDLMAIHDIETMNLIASELRQINPNVILYGEGWDAGGSGLDESLKASKYNAYQLNDIAVFNDDIRDGIKGSVFNASEPGFINGSTNSKDKTLFGMLGSTQKIGSFNAYALNGKQVVTYVDAHDNLTLFDKLLETNKDATREALMQMQIMSNAMVLTSNGMPFIHAGAEMMRTKGGDHNSYESPDSVNQMDYQLLEDMQSKVVNAYYSDLIHLRKEHSILRQVNHEDIQKTQILNPMSGAHNQSFGLMRMNDGTDVSWNRVVTIFNPSNQELTYDLGQGNWIVFSDSTQINVNDSNSLDYALNDDLQTITLPKMSMVMLYEPISSLKDELINLVEQVKTLNEEDYAKGDFAKLNQAILDAELLLTNKDVSEDAYEQSIKAIQLALSTLITYKQELQSTIEIVELITKENYTEESLLTLLETLEKAKQLMMNPDSSELEAKQVLEELQTDYSSLITYLELLEILISQYQNLDPSHYTNTSYIRLEEAIQEGIELQSNKDATNVQAKLVIQHLLEAHNQLVWVSITKEDLHLAIETYRSTLPDLYTKESFAVFMDALNNAIEISNNENATQEEVDQALKHLVEAYSQLERVDDVVDTSKLNAKLQEISKMDLSIYTEQSLDLLNQAIQEATLILSDSASTQDDINQALMRLNEVILQLELKQVDKSILEKRVEELSQINKDIHLNDSIDLLEEALKQAKLVLSNPNATQEEVDQALLALENANNQLILKPKELDLSKANALLKQVEELKQDLYTEQSYQNVINAKEELIKVLNSFGYNLSPQEVIDQAVLNLQNAINQLVEKPKIDQPNNKTLPNTGQSSNAFALALILIGSLTLLKKRKTTQ